MHTILVVDDDDDIRRLLRRFLEQAGHEVIEAASADAALEILAADPQPDAVVSDVLMPGKTGLAFYDDLVRLAPDLSRRVVFLTGAVRVRLPALALGEK